jgi:hypothetical protein
MKLSEFIAAAAITKYSTGEELARAIESSIRKHFPKSYVSVNVASGIGGPSIRLTFAVAGSKEEVPNKIWNNDISLTKGFIWGLNKDGTLKDKLEWDPAMGGSFLINPEQGSPNAFSKIKVGLRKKKGTPEQVVKHLDNYFKKLAATIKSNIDKIPEGNKKLLKSLK